MNKLKRIFVLCLSVVLVVLLSGCEPAVKDAYNQNDTRDFSATNMPIAKFEIVNLNNVLDVKTIKEANLSASAFLFVGGASGSYKESEELQNYYYGYVKNKYGAMYFAKIPVDHVRIYEDAPAKTAYLVGGVNAWCSEVELSPVDENAWGRCYAGFNLHVPPGTVIPKANVEVLTKVSK